MRAGVATARAGAAMEVAAAVEACSLAPLTDTAVAGGSEMAAAEKAARAARAGGAFWVGMAVAMVWAVEFPTWMRY